MRAASREAAWRVLRDRLGPGEIVRTARGKPYLESGELEFTFAWRAPWCALAFSRDCPVGVDVELARPMSDMAAIVGQFFPPVAQRAYAAAPGPETFFLWWTRIEAAVKASGLGLDAAPQAFDGITADSREVAPGVFLGVAAQTAQDLRITWPPSS